MFGEIMVKEPLEKIVEDWDFLQEKVIGRFSTFLPYGQNIYGIRRRNISFSQGVVDPRKGSISEMWELSPKGIVSLQFQPLNTHFTFSGTPHRVPHSFGYWHINDKDEFYVKLPATEEGELGYSFTIMGMPSGDECDRFAWYCEECLTLMHEEVYETGRMGFEGFWKAEYEAVKSYNSDIQHRTCPECGRVNPLGYCWSTNKDTPEQKEARLKW